MNGKFKSASAACVLLCVSTSHLFAMGGDYAIDMDGNIVTQQPNWPAGLAELINSGPVCHGHWVNANSEFFFLGDTASLTRFLKRYSTLKNTPLVVVLHAGSARRSELWGDKPSNRYDWKVMVRNRDWDTPEKAEKAARDRADKWAVTIDVWIDHDIRLADLVVPQNVRLESAGEIEALVVKHHAKLPQPAAASNASGRSQYPNDLMGDAEKTSAAYFRAIKDGIQQPDSDIPPAYWAERIKALHPLKVYSHRINIVVVQKMQEDVEEGKYIYNPISSYLPMTGGDGFNFIPNPKTGDTYALGNGVFHFTRTRTK